MLKEGPPRYVVAIKDACGIDYWIYLASFSFQSNILFRNSNKIQLLIL